MNTLANHIKDVDNMQDRRFCFILGAGASKQSGIPTGEELADKIDR